MANTVLTGQYCHDWPIQAERIRLIACKHVEFDGFIAFELESVGSCNFILWSYLCQDFFDRLKTIYRPAKVEGIVPVEFGLASSEFKESRFELLLKRMLTTGLGFPFYIATQAATLTDSNHIAGGCLLGLTIFHLRIDKKSASNLIVIVSKIAS